MRDFIELVNIRLLTVMLMAGAFLSLQRVLADTAGIIPKEGFRPLLPVF
jgi:hypothetical protein